MDDFDKLIDSGLYSNRSIALQEAMRDLIKKNNENTLLKMKVNMAMRPPMKLATKEEPTDAK